MIVVRSKPSTISGTRDKAFYILALTIRINFDLIIVINLITISLPGIILEYGCSSMRTRVAEPTYPIGRSMSSWVPIFDALNFLLQFLVF